MDALGHIKSFRLIWPQIDLKFAINILNMGPTSSILYGSYIFYSGQGFSFFNETKTPNWHKWMLLDIYKVSDSYGHDLTINLP